MQKLYYSLREISKRLGLSNTPVIEAVALLGYPIKKGSSGKLMFTEQDFDKLLFIRYLLREVGMTPEEVSAQLKKRFKTKHFYLNRLDIYGTKKSTTTSSNTTTGIYA